MTDPLLIRPAREHDCEFVAGFAPSLLESGSPAGHDPDALAPRFREALAQAVRAQGPGSAVLIAERADGARVGFISLRVGTDAAGASRGHVADLAVTADARRSGVGTALLKAGEAWARDRGLPFLSLNVWSTNEPARAFYGRLGYAAESLCLVKRVN